MSTAVQTTNPNAGAVSTQDRIEVQLGKMIEKFQAVLPVEIPAERFCRVAINALQDPRVAEVAETSEGRQSIFTECLIAATDGLLLDKREAFLNVYKTKSGNDWVPLAKYMPMYQGLLKLARNSGVISDVKCQLVQRGDVFAVDMTPPAGICPITHRYPEDIANRGDIIAVYAVAEFKDGKWSNAEVMTVGQVEKIRAGSPARDKDAWTKHWGEMARKTVIRRLSKYLPKSTDGMERLHNAASRDGNLPPIEHVSAPALERKQPMAAKLLAPKVEPAKAEPEKKPEPAKAETPKQEVLPPEKKEPAKAETKKQTKQKATPADDGDPGPQERRGEVLIDPMTGEPVNDEDNGI